MGGAPLFEPPPRRFVCPTGAVGASGFHRSPDPGGDIVGQLREHRRSTHSSRSRCAGGAGELLIPHSRTVATPTDTSFLRKSVLNCAFGRDGAGTTFLVGHRTTIVGDTRTCLQAPVSTRRSCHRCNEQRRQISKDFMDLKCLACIFLLRQTRPPELHGNSYLSIGWGRVRKLLVSQVLGRHELMESHRLHARPRTGARRGLLAEWCPTSGVA